MTHQGQKAKAREDDQFNYRIVTYTYTSLNFIYDAFYKIIDGKLIKIVPVFIGEYLTPFGLALWIMDDGSRQKGQGIYLATHSFNYEDVQTLSNLLIEKYGFSCLCLLPLMGQKPGKATSKGKTSIIKSGKPNQWRISI